MRFVVPCLILCSAVHGATGIADPQLSPFDGFVNGLLAKWRIPGAAIGVSHNGRLVLARGYGMANTEPGRPIQPESRFRIGGISKAITAAAILRLAEDGKFSLDDRAFPILGGSGAPVESRTTPATIRELLETGVEQPVPVNCSPNLAYCVLDRIVEKTSGQSYESYVQSAILTPLGISRLQFWHTVPLEAGWIASVSDLLRFANALDGRRPSPILKPASIEEMLARPAAAVAGALSYNGLGWIVQPIGDDADWRISGGQSGFSAWLLRQAAAGVDVALLFNSRPSDGDAFDADVRARLETTLHAIAHWPSNDLFVDGPEIFKRDIENAADHSTGKVAPGEIVILYPSNAGPEALAGSQVNSDGKVATLIGETRVLFDGVPAPMASAVKGRIGAVVPYEIANHKTTQVVVEYQGLRSPPVTLPVIDTTPALFTLDGTGKGQAAMLNETGCCNAARNPAARGNIVTLFATGEGQTTPPGVDGSIARYTRTAVLPKPRLPISVTVGGVPATIVYSGGAADSVAGSLQVNFRVPLDAPLGDTVPLVLTVGRTHSPDGVTMAVRSQIQQVLVFDADAAVRGRLTRILKAAGYQVFSARDGSEALAEASQHPLDMVISSLAIPETERVETIRAIASERRQLKIVALARALDPDALRAADMLGAQAILTKPVAAEVLLRRIREILRVHPVPYVSDGKPVPAPLPAMP